MPYIGAATIKALVSLRSQHTNLSGTHHKLTKIVVSAGMTYPWYSSSATLQCATPRGAALCHRSSSFTTAEMYGRASRSAKVGSLSGPTILSSSSLAFCWTSGWRESAGKRLWSVANCFHLAQRKPRRARTGCALTVSRPAVMPFSGQNPVDTGIVSHLRKPPRWRSSLHPLPPRQTRGRVGIAS